MVDIKDQYDKIYRYCYFHVHNRDIAEDLTQETFLRFLEHPQYHNKNRDLQYLYTIAGNLCIDEYRRRKTDALLDDTADDTAQEEVWISNIVLHEALQTLSDTDREILLLRYVNEVPISVLSGVYHISRFALSRRIKKILSNLREKIDKEGVI